MAEIIPDSTITLLFDVPLNNKYDNTYLFTSINEQAQFFFNSFQKLTFNQQSYQRKNKGWLRLSARYRDVYKANYMYFMNNWRTQTSSVPEMVYEQKSFYAFITQVDYINDMTVEIHYQIDLIQTYMFDWAMPQCLVERETVDYDSYFLNYIDEGIPIPEYVNGGSTEMEFSTTVSGASVTKPLSQMKYVVAATMTINYEDTSDGADITSVLKGAVSGCQYHQFGSADACKAWLADVPGEKQNGILGIYLVPEIISTTSSATNLLSYTLQYSTYDFFSFAYQGDWGTVNPYTPKNKKLYHAPFCALVIINSEGTSVSFDPTLFRGTAFFSLRFTPTMPLNGYLYSTNYKVISPDVNAHALTAIPLPSVPTFTWSNDTYKAWLALNSGYMATTKATSIIDIGATVASGVLQAFTTFGASVPGTIGAITSELSNINNLYTSEKNAQIVPDSYNGTAQNQTSALCGQYGFYIYRRWPARDVTVSIDNYFTMFGYKVNVLKTPSLENRTRFTYIKTANMDINGEIPTDDRDTINTIFNNGIRFWKDKTNFCDYSLDNPSIHQIE